MGKQCVFESLNNNISQWKYFVKYKNLLFINKKVLTNEIQPANICIANEIVQKGAGVFEDS